MPLDKTIEEFQALLNDEFGDDVPLDAKFIWLYLGKTYPSPGSTAVERFEKFKDKIGGAYWSVGDYVKEEDDGMLDAVVSEHYNDFPYSFFVDWEEIGKVCEINGDFDSEKNPKDGRIYIFKN